jgi:hypothetical protein
VLLRFRHPICLQQISLPQMPLAMRGQKWKKPPSYLMCFHVCYRWRRRAHPSSSSSFFSFSFLLTSGVSGVKKPPLAWKKTPSEGSRGGSVAAVRSGMKNSIVTWKYLGAGGRLNVAEPGGGAERLRSSSPRLVQEELMEHPRWSCARVSSPDLYTSATLIWTLHI